MEAVLFDLLDPSPANRTSAIRKLRFEGPPPEAIRAVAESDESPFVRFEALAYLAEHDDASVEALTQAVLGATDRELQLYGDYLLRELNVFE